MSNGEVTWNRGAIAPLKRYMALRSKDVLSPLIEKMLLLQWIEGRPVSAALQDTTWREHANNDKPVCPVTREAPSR